MTCWWFIAIILVLLHLQYHSKSILQNKFLAHPIWIRVLHTTQLILFFRATIFSLRLDRIQNKCLSLWENFTIWNAGKMGRKFYRALNPENQNKVKQFCDVDPKKIAQKFYHPYPLENKIPIVHFKDAHPPFVICVKTVCINIFSNSFHNTDLIFYFDRNWHWIRRVHLWKISNQNP